jgi:cation transport ATPase
MPAATNNGTVLEQRDPASRRELTATTIDLGVISSAAALIRIEHELESIDGVRGAVIDVTTGRARVIHVPEHGDAQAFIAAVRRTGFDPERPRARTVRA